MKQSRRKELKTNDLSVYLQQLRDWTEQNATYLLAGLAAIILILVVALYVRHNRYTARQEAWKTYNELLEGDVVGKPELLTKAGDLASARSGDADLGPLALQLKGDLAYQLAMSLHDEKDRDRRTELLNTAKAAYTEELERFGERQEIRARARMGLAAVLENLVIAGQADKAEVRRLYQQVVEDAEDGRANAFVGLAQAKLAGLDERLQPLKIIATRPAATAPATQPATAPATGTAAAATVPAP